MYKNRLAELTGEDEKSILLHTGRFKDRLLHNIPDLRAEKDGKELYIISSKDIGPAIQNALKEDMDENAVNLVKAAEIVRKDIFQTTCTFSGSFENSCERNAIPQSLLALVRMILEGPTIENQRNCNATREHIAVVLSELIYFNTVKRSREKDTKGTTDTKDSIRHNPDMEPPLPIYLSMLIHAKTRSKDLINTLFNLGLCVSYKRLMDISTDLANNVCAQYHEEQVVCPPQLSNGVFTCGAVDNIDHNPSARTAHDSFHGTAISLIQFPTSEKLGEKHVRPTNVAKKSKISPLPQRYTLVPPVRETPEPVVPQKVGSFTVDPNIINGYMKKEMEWLSHLATLIDKK